MTRQARWAPRMTPFDVTDYLEIFPRVTIWLCQPFMGQHLVDVYTPLRFILEHACDQLLVQRVTFESMNTFMAFWCRLQDFLSTLFSVYICTELTPTIAVLLFSMLLLFSRCFCVYFSPSPLQTPSPTHVSAKKV